MRWLSGLFGTQSDNDVKEADSKDDAEKSESELSTDEVIDVRTRLKTKASLPIIPQDIKDKMDEEIREAEEDFSESNRAVQSTLCTINEELDSRCEKKKAREKSEEKAETRSTL